MQTYTDGRHKVICDLARPRLLQPDKVTAISAFGEIGRMQNLKNNPMHSCVKRRDGGRAQGLGITAGQRRGGRKSD
jgi:hypothetical protein